MQDLTLFAFLIVDGVYKPIGPSEDQDHREITWIPELVGTLYKACKYYRLL